MPRGTGFRLSKHDIEIHKRGRAAFAEAKRLLPGWRAMARMLARNPKLQVGLHSHMTSFTDGENISIRIPPELAELPEHDRAICGLRDDNNVLVCPACDVLEDVNITIIHELSHIIFDTFEEVSPYEQAQLLQNAIMMGAQGRSADSRAAKIKRRIDSLPAEDRSNYLALGNAISPFMPTLINACEDIRVNSLMQNQRPGTRIMFDAQTQKVFDHGVKQLDGNYMKWIDQPLNAQAIIGVYCKVGGFRYEHALRPEVVTALDDPELVDLCNQMRDAKSVRQVYRLSMPLLEILRRLGFCLDEDDPEDEPDPGEGMEDTEGEDQQDNGDDSDQAEGEPSDSPGDQDDRGAESQSDDDEPEEGESGEGSDSDEPGDSDDSDGDDSSEGSGDPSDKSEGEGDGDGSSGDESDTESDASSTDGDEDGQADSSSGEGSSESSADESSDSGRPDEMEGGDGAEDLDENGSGDSGGEDDPSSHESDEGSADSTDAEDGQVDGPDDPSEAAESPQDGPPTDDPGEAPGSPTDGTTDPSESPQDGGKETTDSGFDPNNEEMGTPEDMERILVQFGRHEEQKSSPSEAIEEQALRKAIEMAIEQMQFFDSPSLNVSGVTEHKLEDATGAWAHSPFYKDSLMEVDEGVLSTALQRLRIMFTDNARGRTERNRRTGKVDGRVLAKRAPAGDDRLFKKRIRPGRRDYFVLIGLDVSGSTAHIIGYDGGKNTCRLDMMKAAAGAKAELLSRLGIPFAMYAHSGSMTAVDIFEIKGPKDRWGTATREALAKLKPYSANLDGHTLEYYRKVIEKRQETDRLLLYYTDGAMPAANFDEELEILQREIKNLDQMGVHLIGIGVQSDAPKEHGLDTILLDELEDIPDVVKQLRNRLIGKI